MYQRVVKRGFDIAISLFGLLLTAIVYVIVVPAIWLEDHGPIFYNAERIGQHGKLFKMYKFRSMRVNAPDIRLADGSTYNGEDDPRVTKVGRFLRKTSIDELPQLLNVLKGDMSLIGPRPDPPDWLDKYPDDIRVFLQVKPGITGYNQAYYRNAADGETKMIHDAYYARNCTFKLDVKILFKTIAVVLKQENIHCDAEREDEATVAAVAEEQLERVTSGVDNHS